MTVWPVPGRFVGQFFVRLWQYTYIMNILSSITARDLESFMANPWAIRNFREQKGHDRLTTPLSIIGSGIEGGGQNMQNIKVGIGARSLRIKISKRVSNYISIKALVVVVHFQYEGYRHRYINNTNKITFRTGTFTILFVDLCVITLL